MTRFPDCRIEQLTGVRNEQIRELPDTSGPQPCSAAWEGEGPSTVGISHGCLDVGHPSLPDLAGDEADAELDQVFPNCRFTHLLVVVSVGQLGVTIRALSVINEFCGTFCGTVDSLRVTRIGGKLEHRFRLTGLRPGQARAMATWLATQAGVERSHVEHHMVTAAASRDRS